MKNTFKLFDGDNQRLIGTYREDERQAIIDKYEGQGFDIGEDHDGDLVFFEEAD